jgi:hypothetical protein
MIEFVGKLVSEFYSDDKARRAEVHLLSDGIPQVFFFEDGYIVELEFYSGYTLQYAEDSAENWCLGIKKLPYELL